MRCKKNNFWIRLYIGTWASWNHDRDDDGQYYKLSNVSIWFSAYLVLWRQSHGGLYFPGEWRVPSLLDQASCSVGRTLQAGLVSRCDNDCRDSNKILKQSSKPYGTGSVLLGGTKYGQSAEKLLPHLLSPQHKIRRESDADIAVLVVLPIVVSVMIPASSRADV